MCSISGGLARHNGNGRRCFQSAFLISADDTFKLASSQQTVRHLGTRIEALNLTISNRPPLPSLRSMSTSSSTVVGHGAQLYRRFLAPRSAYSRPPYMLRSLPFVRCLRTSAISQQPDYPKVLTYRNFLLFTGIFHNVINIFYYF